MLGEVQAGWSAGRGTRDLEFQRASAMSELNERRSQRATKNNNDRNETLESVRNRDRVFEGKGRWLSRRLLRPTPRSTSRSLRMSHVARTQRAAASAEAASAEAASAEAVSAEAASAEAASAEAASAEAASAEVASALSIASFFFFLFARRREFFLQRFTPNKKKKPRLINPRTMVRASRRQLEEFLGAAELDISRGDLPLVVEFFIVQNTDTLELLRPMAYYTTSMARRACSQLSNLRSNESGRFLDDQNVGILRRLFYAQGMR
jgi:nucleoid-associated protein YgaU